MNYLALLLVAVCATVPFAESASPGLRVRFDIGIDIGGSFFISMPRTVAEAKTQRLEQVQRPTGPMPSLSMYCTGDRMFCVLFDDLDYIAGVQQAIPQDLFEDAVFDWTVQGWTTWTVDTSEGVTTTFHAIQQYFVSEDILAQDAADRLATYDEDKILPYDAVWVAGFNGELMYISNQEEDIQQTLFTTQACIPWMGQHYYYNMSASTVCSSETILPWFPLVDGGELIGMGLAVPGVLPADSLARDYFERPERSAIEGIVPRGPECLYAYGDTPGMLTMHTYYIERPWLVICL